MTAKYRLKNRELQKKLEAIGGKNNVRKAIDEFLEEDGGVLFLVSCWRQRRCSGIDL